MAAPFSGPWAAVPDFGDECHYCRRKFTDQHPPTFDHLIPRAHGGKRDDGWVLACGECNNARGSAPYDEYIAAVLAEHERAEQTKTRYIRPKRVSTPDGYEITTDSRLLRREKREGKA